MDIHTIFAVTVGVEFGLWWIEGVSVFACNDFVGISIVRWTTEIIAQEHDLEVLAGNWKSAMNQLS